MYSIFDLFKIGVGPSSSHTVGPMIAAFRFGKDCLERNQPGGKSSESIARLQVQLYGSLALTGIGHATDTAILVGLAGCLPDRTDAMRGDERRPPDERFAEGAKDVRFSSRIHRRQRVVEDDDAWTAGEGARQRRTLLLSP